MDRVGHDVSEVDVLPDEPGLPAKRHAHQIVKNEDLNIAVEAGSYAYGGDLKLLCDHCRDLARHEFKHDGKRPGIFQELGVFNKLLCLLGRSALNAVTAHFIYRLRC